MSRIQNQASHFLNQAAIRNRFSVSNPDHTSWAYRNSECSTKDKHMCMHLNTQTNTLIHTDFQGFIRYSLSWVKELKRREAEINLEHALFMCLPSWTPFTSPPLIYITIYSFIFGEVLQAAVVDIWHYKMLINIQICWFYMVRQFVKKRIMTPWIKKNSLCTYTHSIPISVILWEYAS